MPTNPVGDIGVAAVIPRMFITPRCNVVINKKKQTFGFTLIELMFVVVIISILASLNERRREMAILRAIGAKPIQIFTLFTAEATTIAFLGVVIGFFSLYSTLFIIQPFIENLTGLYLDITLPKWNEIILMVTIMGAAVLAGIIPALRAYRTSLSDGLMIRG